MVRYKHCPLCGLKAKEENTVSPEYQMYRCSCGIKIYINLETGKVLMMKNNKAVDSKIEIQEKYLKRLADKKKASMKARKSGLNNEIKRSGPDATP